MAAAFYDGFASPNGMALVLSCALLVVSAALFAYRFIGFIISCALVFFMLASGFAIANNQVVTTWLDSHLSAAEKTQMTNQLQIIFSLPTAVASVQKLFQNVVETLSNRPSGQQSQKPPTQGTRKNRSQRSWTFGIIERPKPNDHVLFEL